MFEFAEIMEPTMQVLKGIEDDLRVIKYVWDVSSLVETQFASWRSTLWNDINTEAMEDASRRFVKEVKTLPKQARHVCEELPRHDSPRRRPALAGHEGQALEDAH